MTTPDSPPCHGQFLSVYDPRTCASHVVLSPDIILPSSPSRLTESDIDGLPSLKAMHETLIAKGMGRYNLL